jgi:hypothetical protein
MGGEGAAAGQGKGRRIGRLWEGRLWRAMGGADAQSAREGEGAPAGQGGAGAWPGKRGRAGAAVGHGRGKRDGQPLEEWEHDRAGEGWAQWLAAQGEACGAASVCATPRWGRMAAALVVPIGRRRCMCLGG